MILCLTRDCLILLDFFSFRFWFVKMVLSLKGEDLLDRLSRVGLLQT